jgi:hypothetical protein
VGADRTADPEGAEAASVPRRIEDRKVLTGILFVLQDARDLVARHLANDLDVTLRLHGGCEARPVGAASSGGAVHHVAQDLGVHKESLRHWVRQAEAESGRRRDLLTSAFGLP